MRVGISINSTYQVDDYREGPQAVLEQARAAAWAGLDTLSLGRPPLHRPGVVPAKRAHAGGGPR
ncbi:hypothetical protein K6U06_13550 [Acidiferrimicrobium sp. IK]|uniref:hypothetical protein n=1 Tax=Acidiferrimicrobium sp. IK TaxID=2871700 RepID=UPI0021CB8869|nr:hypothetical protein [Acidiferrimicrobium sp. IK]MCU4185392.1 hypothetical protein [Acidiferrimicrobium sp. IK]